ncbi:LysR family transcriptional regulator [Candidatus Thalassolituus haligoni]|uniref:LysR family transcriptional regulator n=1 Tax=Candidatus Thalassolituus haligoni TaxID=3100113 RepID=UPI0035146AB1|tara:strand:- start:1405 stop:2388 length:984 start_codon:yes stop_codon:yes gene_type:complete
MSKQLENGPIALATPVNWSAERDFGSAGMVNYQDLYYFVVVVEKGSLIAAARFLNVPLSTLSRRIQGFEKSLGYKLIHRTAKHFGLTESGVRLYDSVHTVIHDLEMRVDGVNSELSSLSGEIKITAPIAVGHHYIKPLVLGFMQQNPRVSVELLLSNDHSDLVKNSIDIAFRLGPITLNDWISRPLMKAPVMLCAAADFDFGARYPEHPSQLALLPLIATRGLPVWRFNQGEESVSFVPKAYFRTDEARLALDMVLEKVGLACLPEYLVAEALASGRLRQLLPDWGAGYKQVNMIYPHRSNLPTKTRAFIDYVIARYEPLKDMALVS